MGDDGAGHLNTPEWQLPLRRSGPGCYEVALSDENRELLRTLPAQLRAAIAANPKDAVFRRLFPPAYPNDEMAEQEYRRLVGSELDQSRSLAFETLSKTADATELSEGDRIFFYDTGGKGLEGEAYIEKISLEPAKEVRRYGHDLYLTGDELSKYLADAGKGEDARMLVLKVEDATKYSRAFTSFRRRSARMRVYSDDNCAR